MIALSVAPPHSYSLQMVVSACLFDCADPGEVKEFFDMAGATDCLFEIAQASQEPMVEPL